MSDIFLECVSLLYRYNVSHFTIESVSLWCEYFQKSKQASLCGKYQNLRLCQVLVRRRTSEQLDTENLGDLNRNFHMYHELMKIS